MLPINRAIALTAWLAALALPSTAAATLYCVGTAAELQQALTQSAGSASDDEIRLRAGTYTPAQTLTYPATTAGWLELSGGWIEEDGVPCARRSQRAGDTVLDGQGQRQVFNLYYNPALVPATSPRYTLANLTVRNGFGEGFVRGGGLSLQSPGEGHAEFWLDNLIVSGNSGYYGGGAHLYLKRGLLRISNSLFVDNAAPSSAYGHFALTITAAESAHSAMILNSTFVGGRCAGDGSRGCGIGAGLGGGARMDIVNSLFADNQRSDVSIEGLGVIGLGNGTAYYDHSRVPTTSGNLAPSVSAAIEEEPGFLDPAAGDYRLADDSALLDRGRGTIPVFPLGPADLDGRPRLRYAAVDPGAYENQTWDTLLSVDFEARD